ncbi:MAG: NrpR regulatory domain-containing protein [Halobacteriales archaeon]|nr:NrpR regulatory domain-containing protein [Halobacteriales archaeon]
MPPDLERRTYDVLRLIQTHEPIGSIRLTELLRQRGYSMQDRTIRLVLSELDEKGLTEKVAGKGRRLTERGHAELDSGDVSERLEGTRSKITTLTHGVSFAPDSETGDIATSTAVIGRDDIPAALDVLAHLDASSVGPVQLAIDPIDEETVRFVLPSSITLDGVLLSNGIATNLKTAGIVEYHPDPSPEEVPHSVASSNDTGTIIRYTDVINDKESTLDVLRLLIEAGRTDIWEAITGEGSGLLVVDNREAPLTIYQEAVDHCERVVDTLGGVIDISRPRETGPFPENGPAWDFFSITYAGIGENALGLLAEEGLVSSFKTLGYLRACEDLAPIDEARSAWV